MKKTFSFFISLILAFYSAFAVFAAETQSTESGLKNGEPTLLTVNTSAAVTVRAKAYVLMDANTGTLLVAGHENDKLYPASVTKIMTLLLVCDAIDAGKLSFDEVITCSDTAAAKGGSQIWLEPGEQMTVNDLLKAAFVYSANDACTLLGEQIAGSEEAFVQLMNVRAQELGMKNTHFDNCTGLDDDTTTHLSTAYDIALMSRELLKKTYIRNYTTIWMDTLRGGSTQLVNTNKLIRYYKGATGLKTGTTSKAGCCVCATAQRDDLELIAVVLGADNSNDRFNGARALLDYGFAHYEVFTPQVDISLLSEIEVTHGVERNVMPEPKDGGCVLLDKGSSAGITQKVRLDDCIEAPVEKGCPIGSVMFYAGEKLIAETVLVASHGIEKMTAGKAFVGILRSASAKK